MYEIGDIVDVEMADFFGTVELLDKREDGAFEAIFYPEEKVFTVLEEDIVGYACEEEEQ